MPKPQGSPAQRQAKQPRSAASKQAGESNQSSADSGSDQQEVAQTSAQQQSSAAEQQTQEDNQESGESSAQSSDDIDFSEQEKSASASAASSSAQSAGQAQPAGSTSDQLQQVSDSTGASADDSEALTREEQLAQINAKLDQSLSEYDGMILQERAAMQSQANERGSEDQVEEQGGGSLYDDVLNGETASAQQASSQSLPSGASAPETSSAKPRSKSPQQVYAPPADIPSGNDDDVVARQIREAALKEADPKLREKLWHEYRRYKQDN